LYDVELSFAPELPQVPGAQPAYTAAADESRPSILSAIQDQLGLKLNSEKEKIDVLVVDRIEHPTEN
jgi:uncharacterized protein (TIGR03435 family)